MICKPNKLSFPRVELDKVLNSSDYAPGALEIAIASIDDKGSRKLLLTEFWNGWLFC